jgi:RNA polymerase sigma factor (sigma-70 family)
MIWLSDLNQLFVPRRAPPVLMKTQRKTWLSQSGRNCTGCEFARTECRRAKLAYYSGRGSLAGWLRAVVAQLAVDTFRKQSRLVQTEEDTDFDRLALDAQDGQRQSIVAGIPNPEESVSNQFAQNDMQQALGTAVQELDGEDRLLVKLYYFDNLRLREAGAVLGVHEATASRRLTRIQTDLRKRVTKILVDERGWTPVETERSFAEVAQYLDTDLEALLSKEGV